jgi:hypothetical protein
MLPNQARTLLLNISSIAQPDATFYGQEYVAPGYSAVTLPSGLQTVRRALFGGDPDMAGLNYTVWQYMRILHSTEFREYVLALDDRITYLNRNSLVDAAYGPTVDPDDGALQFAGTPDLGDASGRLGDRWQITRPTPASVTILNYRLGRQETYFPAFVGGVSDYIPMVGHTTYIVRILEDYAVGTAWQVKYLAEAGIDMDIISRAAQLSKIGAEAYVALFPSREPYKLFKELWEHHILLPYKLSGALLALIYQTEEIRVGG